MKTTANIVYDGHAQQNLGTSHILERYGQPPRYL